MDDGDRLKKRLVEKREKVQQFLDEAMTKFALHKFVGIFAYMEDSNGLIEAELPFVYPQEYIDFMQNVQKRIRVFMGKTLDEALEMMVCNDITKLSAFQNTYNKAIKILRNNKFDKQAEDTEKRVAQIVEETKARNQYSQALGECEKDIALFSGNRKLTYVECETMNDKFSSWLKFLSEAKLPSSITKPLSNRIDKIMDALQVRKKEIVGEVDTINKNFETAASRVDLVSVKSQIEVVLNNNLPDEMEISLRERLQKTENVIQEIQQLPENIEELGKLIAINKKETHVSVYNEARSMQNNLLDKQQKWVDKVITPVEEGKIVDAQQCSIWIEKLRAIPKYVNKSTSDRALVAEKVVTKQLHSCKVQGVLSLYNTLTQEEKDEFMRLIQK